MQFEYTAPAIGTSERAFVITHKGRELGETKRTTPIKRTYTGSIEESAMGAMPLILFFALLHTFWCGFHRN